MDQSKYNESSTLKESISRKLSDFIGKLGFIYEIQDKEFWYLNIAKLNRSDLECVNEDFTKRIGEEFIELGLNQGNSFEESNELTVELYKFNQTLTRLLNKNNDIIYKTITVDSIPASSSSSVSTPPSAHSNNYSIPNNNNNIVITNRLDSNLIVKTLIKLLITKLTKLQKLLHTTITQMETRLIEDVLVKNISSRVLKPYHNLLIARAQSLLFKMI